VKINRINTIKLQRRIDWTIDLDALIKNCRHIKPQHFEKLQTDMMLLYNVSKKHLPFKTIILFTDATVAITEQDTSELMKVWHQNVGFFAEYFNKQYEHLMHASKKRPHTVGKYSFQRFKDDFATMHYLALHNIHDFYHYIKPKTHTYIEMPTNIAFILGVKKAYLDAKINMYKIQRDHQLEFFNQMSYYSQAMHSHTHQVCEEIPGIHQPSTHFGQLDTIRQLIGKPLE